MKAGGGKSKGSSFERLVANLIVSAFSDQGIKQIDCYRTPMSGEHIFAHKKNPGDLVMSQRLLRLFPFSVECKFYADFDVLRFLCDRDSRKPTWNEFLWLKQACSQAKNNTYPLLVFKRNNSPIFCCVPLAHYGLGTIDEVRHNAFAVFEFEDRFFILVLFADFLQSVADADDLQ